MLMESDINFSNMLVYGVRMMNNMCSHKHMPEEIYSEKGKTVDDGTLAKVFFYDISRQTRTTNRLRCVDTTNCYDSVAHAIDSLVFQAFEVQAEAVKSVLTVIEEMTYFLCTVFGDSTSLQTEI